MIAQWPYEESSVAKQGHLDNSNLPRHFADGDATKAIASCLRAAQS